jgi:hypothetical protein
MPSPIFISYSRQASATHAAALAARLGDLAFLDTTSIDDGDDFPHRLFNCLLDASIVVIFASQAYTESRFCRLEMRLALAGGDAEASHLVLALGDASVAVLDAMPAAVASQNWLREDATDRLDALVRRLLAKRLPPIRDRLAAPEAPQIVGCFP